MAAQDRSPGRVILTYSRSYQALAAIRSLGRRGVEVIAGDEYAVTPGSLSRYTTARFEYPSPSGDPSGFLERLEGVVRAHRPADDRPYVLMPVHRESALIARERHRFEGLVRLPLASSDAFRVAEHKGRLARFAVERAVPIPRTWFPEDEGDLRRLARELRFPVFVKIPSSASGVGVAKVRDADGLLARFRDLVEAHQLEGEDLPLVQEAAEGHDYCVTCLFDQGVLRATMTYRNVMTWPRGHGAGVVRETVAAEPAERLAERLLAALGWHGIAQVDFRWTGSEADPPLLLEINPRFFGGLFQAVESGVDYPWLLFRVAMGWEVRQPEVDLEARTEAPVLGLLATVREIAADEASMEQLEQAWRLAKSRIRAGRAWEAARSLLGQLRHTLDPEERFDRARRLLTENEQNVSVLFDQRDDPLPVLGLIYPIGVFLRHGKVSHELMSSTEVTVPE